MHSSKHEIEEIETELFLEAVFRCYGFDFRQYAPGSLKRRIRGYMRTLEVTSVSAFQDQVLHDPAVMEQFVQALSINVTDLFRDPHFFLRFRREVAPLLREYPAVRIWHAGCSTGEEVYSMAILLKEERLYDKCILYATDLNESVLSRAREGVFPIASMREYSQNYSEAGGTGSLSEYYSCAYDRAILASSLRERIVFAQHNLVTDSSFNDFHVILCRNVMIYFNRALQAHVHELFYDSLQPRGILGLGLKEAVRFSPHEADYEELDVEAKLYRKVR